MKKKYKITNPKRWELFKLIAGSMGIITIIIIINQIFGFEAMTR